MVDLQADEVLGRFWTELGQDAALSALVALVPTDRKLTIFDALPLAPVVMAQLRTPAQQLQVLDALGHAYARARGLHFAEE